MKIKKINLKKYLPKFAIKYYNIVLIAIKEFRIDKCPLKASALTLYSIASIVPILALIFGIAKGFGYEKVLKEQILNQIPHQEVMIKQIISFVEKTLNNTQGGLVASFGIIFLLWTVIKVLESVEETFNDIWQVDKNRIFVRKFSDYLSIMLILPFFLILSSSLTIYLQTTYTDIAEKIFESEFILFLVLFPLKFIPYVIIWIGFSLLFIIMPNIKINYLSGIIAGILTGTLYQIVQLLYISLQIGVARYNAIYGSFAAIPLFILWLQISWNIILFGAEFSFSHQNYKENKCYVWNFSSYQKRIIYLQIVYYIIKAFEKNEKNFSSNDLLQKINIPKKNLLNMLFDLKKANVLALSQVEENLCHLYPAISTNHLTIAYVLENLELIEEKKDNFSINEENYIRIKNLLDNLNNIIKNSKENLLIKDIP